MAAAGLRKILSVVSGAHIEGRELIVEYSPVSGRPPQLLDSIAFAPEGELHVVDGVGRFLRLLRAGRVVAPPDPYRLARNLALAGRLAARCRGARVVLDARSRYQRALSVWTESGLEEIKDVMDFSDEPEELVVRKRGVHTPIRIPRSSLVRFEPSSREYLEIVGLSTAPR